MTEPTRDFTDILAESIEAIERGELTDRECLEKYPAYAGHLGELLPVMAMLHEAPQVELNPVFRQQSPSRLLAQLPPAAGENVGFFDALRHKWQRFGFPIQVQTMRPGMAWIIILAIFATFIAGSGVIYAADTAVPGDPLYAVDRSLETLRLNLANDPAESVALRLALADERLSEAQTLATLGDAVKMQQTLEEYGESILAASQTMLQVRGQEREALMQRFDETLPEHEAIIAGLLDDDDPLDDNPDEDGDRCSDEADYSEAQAIAEAEGVPVDQVIAWYCGGLGYGEIKLAFRISDQSDIAVDELVQLREDLGWGRIIQAAGLIGSGKNGPGGWADDGDSASEVSPKGDMDPVEYSDLPIDSTDPGDSYDPEDLEDPKKPDDYADDPDDRCASGDTHPQALAIAKANDVPVEQIMEWFCDGFGFGEIKLAHRISNQTDIAASELLDQRKSLGWGQIMQDVGLIGRKDNKPTDPPNNAGKPDRAGPPEDQGSAKKDKSPGDSGPPDHAGKPDHVAQPDNKGNSKGDKSSEDSGPPGQVGKPDDPGQPDKKESSKDDKSSEDNGPPKPNPPSKDKKDRNTSDKLDKGKGSDKSEKPKKE